VRNIQPVHLHDQGDKVFNLHQGLLFLIRHQSGISENDRRTLRQQLAPDLIDDTFGNATLNLVKTWQDQLKNRPDVPNKYKGTFPVNGDVDQPTADVLNWLLTALGY
jgi:hypothetical protein